jgi:hypothetical protein
VHQLRQLTGGQGCLLGQARLRLEQLVEPSVQRVLDAMQVGRVDELLDDGGKGLLDGDGGLDQPRIVPAGCLDKWEQPVDSRGAWQFALTVLRFQEGVQRAEVRDVCQVRWADLGGSGQPVAILIATSLVG